MHLTLRRLTAYVGVVLAALNALGALLVWHPSVVAFVTAGVLASPLGRAILADEGLSLSTPAVVVAYATLTGAGNVWLLLSVA
jgi:hypothetical protein